jgi:hypothetical protein
VNIGAAIASMGVLAVAATSGAPQKPDTRTKSSATSNRTASNSAASLSFKEFFEASPRELKPSQKLLSLNGKRVRMVGYMARMERVVPGAFYLVPHPVMCDEEGGGTSDLPVENVLVLVRSAKDREIAFIPRPLEVTGILEVGNREEKDGRVSAIRLTLDGPPAKAKRTTSISKTTITKGRDQ